MDRQTVLGNHGAPFTFEYEGITYILYNETQRSQAEFERWAKSRAIKEKLADKDILPEKILENQLNKLYELFDSNDTTINYSFEGDKCQTLLKTNEGMLVYFRILLGKQVDKLSEEDLQSMVVEMIDEISAYLESRKFKLEKIQEELGWDAVKDPKGENLDPKAKRRLLKLMKAANL